MIEKLAQRMADKARGFERIQKSAKGGWPGLKVASYIQRNAKGHVTGVLCKRCGCVVKSKGAPKACYMETQINFSDGSRHITPLCSKCATGLDAKALESIYCADLLQLSDEEDAAGIIMQWSLLADRKIVGSCRAD
jgi:hypothetical protein